MMVFKSMKMVDTGTQIRPQITPIEICVASDTCAVESQILYKNLTKPLKEATYLSGSIHSAY